MVLFKRKPVQFLPPAEVEDENTEVWHIPQTGEVFLTYEDFLNRMDFYNQRRFNDQITGQSQMTYFEAHQSELMGGKEVEEAFPEALKGPILRKVQFQTTSRLDHLVDILYDEFKHDYFPGEEVNVAKDGGDKITGLIRDKASFGPKTLSDGSLSQPTSRYLVQIKDSDTETPMTGDQIGRDRGVFTKAMLRSFIKRTVIREAWNGAPWLVKHDYANTYHIDTRVPPHLRYDTKREERRLLQAQKRADGRHDLNGDSNHSGPMRLPELKPAPKGQKGKLGLAGYQDSHADMSPPPPPPPKYPIEDLLLPPREGAIRPQLKFMCRDAPVADQSEGSWVSEKIEMNSVGGLLETWDTLNVYCEVFQLDSFTFDDFVEAMLVASDVSPVQLFDEVHCAVLQILVDSESAGGKVRIALPEQEEEDSEDEEEEADDSQVATPEPEPKPSGRTTRRSLAKQEAERLAAEAKEEEMQAELQTQHRAEELLEEYDWIESLRKRDFADGGWQRIMVGLLNQLSKIPRKEEVCEELLLELVPPGIEPTQETVRQQYGQLDIALRVKALQIICLSTIETKAIRNYMEDCSEQMTKYRKEKIDWQRQRKQAVEEHRQLNDQRRILLPDNMPPSPPAEVVKEEEDVSKMSLDESLVEREDDEETDEEPTARKTRRRPQTEKQRKREEEEERKKKKVVTETAKLPKQSKEFIKLCKDIAKKEEAIKECEREVATIENDLRENDCPRTRVLGKDRFWNRYYWFERNGMPYGGLPSSSTAHAEYANGCIWVQGPDDLEREGYIDVPAELQEEYKATFDMTQAERKTLEENGTSVSTARQWGYISEPEDVVELIKWLDIRGINEIRLRKELLIFKDKIIEHMEKRKAYLAGNNEKPEKEESKRTSIRIREKTPEVPSYRCLMWENTTAMSENGKLHSDPPPPPPRSRKQTKKREAPSEAAPAPAPKSRRR